jgi:nitroreductase
MNVIDAIQYRRAVRLFSERPVPQDVIEQILRAGMRAQSSKNTQPWLFVVVRERETLSALSTLGKFAGHVAGANFAVCFVGTKQTMWNNFFCVISFGYPAPEHQPLQLGGRKPLEEAVRWEKF